MMEVGYIVKQRMFNLVSLSFVVFFFGILFRLDDKLQWDCNRNIDLEWAQNTHITTISSFARVYNFIKIPFQTWFLYMYNI